jgi:hypothetical protein
MPGRHQVGSARRPRVRWLVGVAGGAALAATLLALNSGSAGASTDPVTATFGVTGVATDNCKVSTGGTDVYVKPGQELDVKTSIIGLTLLGRPLDLSKLASLDGRFVIDPQAQNPRTLDITNKVQKITDLAPGDHVWKWTVSTVKLGVLPIPLGLSSNAVRAGAKLSWDGIIHVTPNAANCGIAVQLPSVSASVSVSGLPPIGIGIPGVKISLPVNVPTSVPSLPGTGGSRGSTGHHKGGHPQPSAIDNPIPVPAKVVPGAGGGGLLGGGPAGGIPLGPIAGGSDPLTGVGAAAPTSTPSVAAAPGQLPRQNSAGKHKTIDLAANRPASTSEVWIVLAIVAVIALAFVAATYARLYLLKRGS